jgi:hypothetical protein
MAQQVVSGAVIEFEGVDDISYLRDNYLDPIASSGNGFVALIQLLDLVNVGFGGFELDHNMANCITAQGCEPLRIGSAGGGNGTAGAITLVGGVYAHCGTSGAGSACANIDIEGDGQYANDMPGAINLLGTNVELANSTDVGVKIFAAHQINIVGLLVDGAAGAEAVLIDCTGCVSGGECAGRQHPSDWTRERHLRRPSVGS